MQNGRKKISPHLKYFSERTAIPQFYQIHRGEKNFAISDKIQVLPFEDFCGEVELK